MRSCCRREDSCERAEGRGQRAERRSPGWAAGPSALCPLPSGRAGGVIVIKFGGTSVGGADRVANAIEIVAERRARKPIVVVSALSGVTNDLVAASEAACEQDPKRVGEIIAAVRQRHEHVAPRLVQQKSDFFES